MLLLTLVFCGLVGFGIGATATGFVIMQESDERRFVEGKSRETFARQNIKWFVVAGGLLGAGSLMGAAWKYWPKDLD
jgi:Na+/glutamate symporter